VLDTNVVLDLLYFDDAAARPLLHALEAGRVRCVVSDATLGEWRRVLAYPEFALDASRQDALFERYQSMALTEPPAAAADRPRVGSPIHDRCLYPAEGTPGWSRMPRCSDPDDQKFIELAATVQAQGLVSKDRAVLKLRRRCAPHFRIMNPAEAQRWLSALPGKAGCACQPASGG
jgi:predicted nucleic acid-binding protein